MRKLHSMKGYATLGAYGLTALALSLGGCTDKKAAQPTQKQAPAQVSIIRVAPQTANLEHVYPARAQAANDVQIRARVQGTLLKRNYTEGSLVKAGTVLFQIDPAPFEARVQQAQADLARAQAQLRQAEREWTRTSALFQDNAVSARQRDEAKSTRELAEASVATAQAVLRDARIQLSYTEVKAPISGYAGIRQVSEGNLIQSGALLTTIRQLDPMHVMFSMPEADAVAHRQQINGGGAATGNRKLAASLLLPTGERYEHKGAIDFTETAIDVQTGSVQVRASIPNPQGKLMPGQFVRVSLEGLQTPNTIMIPSQAIGQGPKGPTVYVVDEKNVAQLRTVKLGQNTREGQIVAEGLSGGDRVIVNGMAKVNAGTPVAPSEAAANAATPSKLSQAKAGAAS